MRRKLVLSILLIVVLALPVFAEDIPEEATPNDVSVSDEISDNAEINEEVSENAEETSEIEEGKETEVQQIETIDEKEEVAEVADETIEEDTQEIPNDTCDFDDSKSLFVCNQSSFTAIFEGAAIE